jgi:hypothetical protein
MINVREVVEEFGITQHNIKWNNKKKKLNILKKEKLS